MPPPISAAQGSDDDQSPSSSGPPVEISDSDLEKDDQETEIEVEEQEIENDNEEEEYEEIIVVEEEEIEEEVEVEEDDMSDSSKEANAKSNDVSQDTEFEGTDRQLGLRSTPGRSSLGLPSNSLVEDGVCNSQFSGPLNEPVKLQEELHVNYEDSKCLLKSGTNGENGSQRSLVKNDTEALMIKKKSKEISKHYSDSMAHFFNDEAMAAETTSPSSITGNEVSNALAIKNSLGMETNGILDSEVDVNPMEKRSEDKKQTTSRLVTLEKRTRSLSPSAEFEDQNKRPAVICDFFSKGWCIRGSSCTFLHIKNKTVNAKEQLEGDAAAANFSKRDQFDEGLKNITEKPKFPGFPDLMASSIGNSAAFSCQFSSERILALENGESQRLHQLDDKHKSLSLQREDLSQGFHSDTQQFPSSKDDHGVSSSLKNVGIENLRRSWPASDYGSYASPINRGSSPSFQSRLLPELRYSSSFSSVTSSNNHRENSFSYLSSLDNLTYIRDQFVQGTSLDGSLSSSVMLPSQQISAWKGPSFSFSSSLNTSPFGSQKLSDNDRNYHASRSLRQSASLLFGSERETSLLTSVSRGPLHYAEHKAKISSNDWEPSIPFRPSFSITYTVASSPGSQYDPLRDSIDLSTTGYRLPFKFSFVSQERSNLNSSHQPIYDNSLSKTLGSECHNDKSTVSLHGRFHENVLDKNCYTPGKVMGGTCVVSGQKGTMPKEENASSSGHLSDVPNTSKIDVDCDSRHEYDAPRHKQDFKVDRVRQKNEMDVDQKTDGESRVLRHFRAALIDFVKELLRPTWREGHLSKDAHNTIAKKAVEKVLRTLQPHQIPTTVESTRQYLSSSQPKIAKLVEGYCTKYGKS